MKAILRIALALLIVAAGVAWAAQDEVEENPPAPQVEQPEQLAPETEAEEIDIEELLKDPDKVDADACCCADCFAAWELCLSECGYNQACRQACRQELNACRANC